MHIVLNVVSNFGFYRDKPDISFDIHLAGLDEQIRDLLLDLRIFIRALGDNVIEEIRPHRISYAKTIVFRTFVDIQPKNDSLVISIRKDRTEPTLTTILDNSAELEAFKKKIAQAYLAIK